MDDRARDTHQAKLIAALTVEVRLGGGCRVGSGGVEVQTGRVWRCKREIREGVQSCMTHECHGEEGGAVVHGRGCTRARE